MKRCNACRLEKDVSEFWKDVQKNDGLHPSCKECGRAKRRIDALTPERLAQKRENQREWKSANQDKVKAHSRTSYENHLESRLARAAKYRELNAEKIREYFRDLAKKRPNRISNERRCQYSKEWRERNLEHAKSLSRAIGQARRARLASVKNTLTQTEWVSRAEEFNSYCAFCLAPTERPTMDHFRPVAKGGDHSLENIVPACGSCNSRKSDSLVFDWLARGVGQCPPSTCK